MEVLVSGIEKYTLNVCYVVSGPLLPQVDFMIDLPSTTSKEKNSLHMPLPKVSTEFLRT